MTTTYRDELDDLLAGDSLGERFVRELWKHGGSDYNRDAKVSHRGILEQRTTVTSSIGWGATQSLDAPTPQLPPVRIGDLFTRLPTVESATAYAVEINVSSVDGGASAVPEGDAKPAIEIDWSGAVLPVQTIAAWVDATKQILDDAPFLQDTIDSLLVGRFLGVREESELLDGDGTGEHLLGLRHVTGIQSLAFSTSVAQTIAKAIGLVEDADGVVDAVAIHPDAFRLSQVTAPTFWTELRQDGIRFVKSKRVGANKAIVGAFRDGGLIRERETAVRFATMHSDAFIKNKLAILAEKREALLTRVPPWFVDVALA
jgi:hypothetical protein